MTRTVLFVLALTTVACKNSDDTSDTADTTPDTDVAQTGCVPVNHDISVDDEVSTLPESPCDTYTLTLAQDTGVFFAGENMSDLTVIGPDGTAFNIVADGGNINIGRNLAAGVYTIETEGEAVADGAALALWDACDLPDASLHFGATTRYQGTIGDGECLSRGAFDNYVFETETETLLKIDLVGAYARADVYRGSELITSVIAGGFGLNGIEMAVEPGVYDVRVFLDGNRVQYSLDVTLTDACAPLNTLAIGETRVGDRDDSWCSAADTFPVEVSADPVFVAVRTESGTEAWHQKGALDFPLYTQNLTWFETGDQVHIDGPGEYAVATSTLSCTTDFASDDTWSTRNLNDSDCGDLVRIPVWSRDGVQQIQVSGSSVDEVRLRDADGTFIDSCFEGCSLWLNSDELMFVEVRGSNGGDFGFRAF